MNRRILLLFLTLCLMFATLCVDASASAEQDDWQKMCGLSTLHATSQRTRIILDEGLTFYKYKKAQLSLDEFRCVMKLNGFETIDGYYSITLTDGISYASNVSGLFLLMYPEGDDALRLEGQILHKGDHVTPETAVLSVDLSKTFTLRGRINQNGTYSLSFDDFETAYTFAPPSDEDFLTSLDGKTYFSFGGCINPNTHIEASIDLYELGYLKTVGSAMLPGVNTDRSEEEVINPMASVNVAPLGSGVSPAESKLSTNGNGGKTDVGMWYVTYNNEANWVNNFGSGYPIKYRPLMPDGSYDILDSSNVEQIDFHLQQMAIAKVDFIILDLTNGGLTPDLSYGWDDSESDGGNDAVANARLVCQRINIWNKTQEWKIKYAISVGTYPEIADSNTIGVSDSISACYAAEKQAQAVYDSFFESAEYGKENYYQVDGKPLLILFDWTRNMSVAWQEYNGDKSYGNRFFIGHADCGSVGSYGWFNGEGTHVNEEVMMISPGHNTAGDSAPDIVRNYGNHYRNSWRTVLSNPLPRILVISSFNDFNEQTAVFVADSSACRPDIEEIWRDLSGAINHSMYWDMTLAGIRLMRIANSDEEGEFDLLQLDAYLPEGVSFPTYDVAVNVAVKQTLNGEVIKFIGILSVVLFVVSLVIILLVRRPLKK